ncbi:MAG: hypothetical protein JW919_00330, partial [Candidatus Omnitrophica bacterium]|nr:hypothetical protein [Candidatus Omnitrophota bacterium]
MSYCDLAPVSAAAQDEKLAPVSIWKPLANEDRALVRQAQLELMLGVMFLRNTKGGGVEDVNAALRKITAARRDVMAKQGLPAGKIGEIGFLNCIWDENDKVLKATF